MRPHFDRKTILIGDDDAPTLRVLGAICKTRGYTVFTASQADDFKDIFFRERPGKLFIDLDFGKVNGLDFYEYEMIPAMLAKNWQYDGIATLLTAVLARSETVVRAHRLGLRFSNKTRQFISRVHAVHTGDRLLSNSPLAGTIF